MNRIRQCLGAALVAILLLAGCSGAAKEPTPAEQPSEQTPAQQPGTQQTPEAAPADPSAGTGEVSAAGIAAAQGVLVLYFDAVVNQDAAMLDFLWFGNPAPEKAPKPAGTRVAVVGEPKLLKAAVIDGMPSVFFEVQVDLGPNPGGTWAPGVNRRWAQVVKTTDGWKVKEMATTPPAL